MTFVSVTVAGNATQVFERKGRFMGRIMKSIGRPALRLVKDEIATEMRQQRSARFGPWARTKPIGRLRDGRPALLHMGQDWAAAPERVSSSEATLSITGPGYHAHVGGKGLQRSTGVVSIRSPGNAAAVRGAVFRATGGGVISQKTIAGSGIQLDKRPHADPNHPVMAGRVERLALRRFEAA